MWFLVRIAFWLGLIIALLPIVPLRQEMSASEVGAVDSLAATSAAVSDILCAATRRLCGSEAIARFVQNAETGAKLTLPDFERKEGQGGSHETPR